MNNILEDEFTSFVWHVAGIKDHISYMEEIDHTQTLNIS